MRAWVCPECNCKLPKKNSDSTPVKRMESCTRSAPGGHDDDDDPDSNVAHELKKFREEMKEFRMAIINLTSSIDRCHNRLDDLDSRLKKIEQRDLEDQPNISNLVATIDHLKSELNIRDQELLANDVEITGISETKEENPYHIVITVATKLGLTLEDRDIVSVKRVGTTRGYIEGELRPRPRPLVLRLVRRSQRDDLLRAARVRRHLTTVDMGLPGDTARFYLNERLTYSNRQLFFKTRQASARSKWKFSWTRDGGIFVRREHGAASHRIRNEADLQKIFGINEVGAKE